MLILPRRRDPCGGEINKVDGKGEEGEVGEAEAGKTTEEE